MNLELLQNKRRVVKSVTYGQTDGRTDGRKDGQVIPKCHLCLQQVTQKGLRTVELKKQNMTDVLCHVINLIYSPVSAERGCSAGKDDLPPCGLAAPASVTFSATTHRLHLITRPGLELRSLLLAKC